MAGLPGCGRLHDPRGTRRGGSAAAASASARLEAPTATSRAKTCADTLTRACPGAALDLSHLIGEVEGLGRSERNAVRSDIRTIIEHCLKLACSPASEPRAGWMSTVGRARDEIEDRLTPTLRRSLRAGLPRLYGQARKDTALELRLFGGPEAADALPQRCPWTLAQLLREDWYPSKEG